MRLMSRAMYAQISAQNSWFSNFYLEDSVVEELVFWQSNLDPLNGRRIWFKSSAVRVAYSDASDTGYGGYIVELGPQVAAQGVWSADFAKESSTMREILAVRNVLQSFAPKLAGLCVKWHTDNQNVARIISVGSRKSGLQSEAKRICEICVHHGISIEPEWVPRSSNASADYLSRIVDFDDWSVSPHIFRFLDLKWGPHSIDRFADEHNDLLPRFDSRFWNPYCEAMDTFRRSWDFDNNWVLSATSPGSADSEAHAVLLRASELMESDGLRSVGGLQVASGWLMQTPLGLFVLASGWLVRSQWVAYVDSIGFICYSQWVVTQILLALFVLCYSQWVACS